MEKLTAICLHQLLGAVYTVYERANVFILAASSILVSIGFFRASFYLIQTLTSTNRLIKNLAAVVKTRDIAIAVADGLRKTVRVNVIPDPFKRAAFTMGWLNPSVYMTSSLFDNADPDTLDIILRHELTHVGRLDPLRTMLLNTLSELLWFVPFIKPQVENWKLAAELACDKSAIDAGHDRLEVARVLLEVAETPISPHAHGSPAVSSLRDSLELRIKFLLGYNPMKGYGIKPGLVIASVMIISAMLFSSGTAVASKLDPAGTTIFIENTVSACDTNDHSSDILASMGIKCPHCGHLAETSLDDNTSVCHSHS